MEDIKIKIGKRLRDLRDSKELKQHELGKALGVSASAIGMYEQGRRSLDSEMLIKISDYFNVSTDYLLCRTNDPNCRILTNKDLPFETDDKLEIGIKKDAELTEEMLNFIIETFKKSGMEIKFKNKDPKKCD